MTRFEILNLRTLNREIIEANSIDFIRINVLGVIASNNKILIQIDDDVVITGNTIIKRRKD